MTVILSKDTVDPPTTPPGWGIFADLTPPELHNARRLKSVRRLLVGVLVLVVLVVAAGYGFARWQSGNAARSLAVQQALTAQLQAQQLRYAPVVELQGSVAAVRAQLAGLMVSDVNFAELLDSIAGATPRTVAITSEQVTISNSAAAAAPAAAAGGSLDTSGIPQIGKVTLAGTVPGLAGFASYVGDLQNLYGFVDVTPGSTAITAGLVTFSITMSVTNQLLTHIYDIVPTTAAAPASVAAPTTTATAQ